MTRSNLRKKEFILAYGSRELQSIMAEKGMACWQDQKASWSHFSFTYRKQRESRKQGEVKTFKLRPPKCYSSSNRDKPKDSITFPNSYQLRTKCSNTWTFEGHFSFKRPQGTRPFSGGLTFRSQCLGVCCADCDRMSLLLVQDIRARKCNYIYVVYRYSCL